MCTLDIGATPVDAMLDSGASRHFSPHRSEFHDFEAIDHEIKTVDGRTFKAVGKGNVRIVLPNDRSTTPVLLKDCVYAPEMAFTLISVSRLAKVTRGVTFNATHAVVTHKQGHVMVRIPKSQGLYRSSVGRDTGLDHANAAVTKMTLMEAHRKLGHAACAAVKSMVVKGMVTGIQIDSNSTEEFCELCTKAKAARKRSPS